MPIARGIMQISRFDVINTQTSIFSGSTPSYCNQNISFNILVINTSPFIGSPPDGGTVQLIDLVTSTILGSGTITSGLCTISISLDDLPPSYQIVAKYLGTSGNPQYSPSTSSTWIQEVNPDTTLSITASMSPNPVCYYNDASLLATISSSISANNPINDGYINFIGVNNVDPSITFLIDGYRLVSGGVATGTADGYDGYITIWPSHPDTFKLRADFYPFGACLGRVNSSTTTIQVVDGYSTSTSVLGSPSSVSSPNPVTYTATITSSDPGTITGTVTFIATGPATINLGTAPVSSGTAVLVVPYSTWTTTGIYSINATFNPGICWLTSTSSFPAGTVVT